MRDFIEFLVGATVFVLVSGALLMGGVFGCAVVYSRYVDKPACEAYSAMSGQKTFFSLGTNCLVERNGEWVDYNVAVGNKQEITVKSK